MSFKKEEKKNSNYKFNLVLLAVGSSLKPEQGSSALLVQAVVNNGTIGEAILLRDKWASFTMGDLPTGDATHRSGVLPQE